MTFSCTELSPS